MLSSRAARRICCCALGVLLASPTVGRADPAPAAVLALAPPGIRPTAERAELSWTRAGSQDATRRLVEVVAAPAGAGSQDWLEVEYTVDPELEARVHAVLAREGVRLGHAILMDPSSGALLSYVSVDPDTFPATRTYPAASLMKLVTAAAMLRADPQRVGHPCRYVGSPYQLAAAQLEPPREGGRVDPFWRTIALSNNQCFARYAVHDVGEEALLGEAARVGLLEAPAAGHAAGRIEPVESALDLGHLGSGLAGSFITPLAAARLAGLLARGELVQPYWIARVRDAEGMPLELPGRARPQRVWNPDLSATLRNLTVQVTTRGTASRGFRDGDGKLVLDPIAVAGKTGTLRGHEPEGRYQWFVGVAPADDPRIAVATLVVNDGPGGAGAARVAAQILREVFCTDAACRAAQLDELFARASARDQEARRELDATLAEQRVWAELDEPPRPIGAATLAFPRELRKRKVDGEIVLVVELSPYGSVLDVQVEASDLPEFEPFVVSAVRGWSFTQPTSRGRPVEARARLPIPIHIR
jgi:TonB family protein